VQNGKKRKVVVIGGGPGGYPAAIKAARLGAEVTLVNKGGLGGTCLQRGCIPTKQLLKSAREYQQTVALARKAKLDVSLTPDLADIMKQKSRVINKLTKGTGFLLKANGVRVIEGTATFRDAKTVVVEESQEVLTADAFIIATGSKSAGLPVPGIDLTGVMDSDQILQLTALPESLMIIGGGYIGLEFAQVFHLLGVHTTVIEMLPRILPTEDDEIADAVLKHLVKSGIEIRTAARLEHISQDGSRLKVAYSQEQKTIELTTDLVLVAVGRKPNIERLGLDAIGVRLTETGFIDVDDRLQTSVPGIFAIGDVVRGPMLAHKATAEGEMAAHFATDDNEPTRKLLIPSVMYTSPEVARAGLTETEATEQYGDLLIGRFPFSASGRASIEGAIDGFVKVIAEAKHETIVGTSIFGPQAGHLIAEAALAIQLEAGLDDVAETVHAHPTLSEAFHEAVLDAKGQAIHMPPKAKASR
jgi:dihydrolipoamide dehydrogenase